MGHIILAIDKFYDPHRWITVEDAMVLEAKELVLDHLGEDVHLYNGGICRATGERSSLVTSSIIVVDGAPNSKRHKDPALTNTSLFQRDRNLCAYCGGLFRASELTRDHIMPVSKGGRDHWMNVVTACKDCNATKTDTLPGHKLASGALGPQGTGKMDPLYVPYIPCKAEHMLLKQRHVKFDQMEFLMERIKNKEKSRVYQEARKWIDAGKKGKFPLHA